MSFSVPRAKKQLDDLYAEIPHLACQGKCHSSCGPIGTTDVEAQRIHKKSGRWPTILNDGSLTCALLTADKTCAVYTIRPTICRLWGVVKELACPWGCEPERWLTYREGLILLERAAIIGDPPEEREEHERTIARLEAMSDAEAQLYADAFVKAPVIE